MRAEKGHNRRNLATGGLQWMPLKELGAVAKLARQKGIIEILRGLDKKDGRSLSIDEYALLWDEQLTILTAVGQHISVLISHADVPERDAAPIATRQSKFAVRTSGSRTVLARLSAVARSASKNAANQILSGLDTEDGKPLTIEGYVLLWDQHMATLGAVRGGISDLLSLDDTIIESARRAVSP